MLEGLHEGKKRKGTGERTSPILLSFVHLGTQSGFLASRASLRTKWGARRFVPRLLSPSGKENYMLSKGVKNL